MEYLIIFQDTLDVILSELLLILSLSKTQINTKKVVVFGIPRTFKYHSFKIYFEFLSDSSEIKLAITFLVT